MTMGSTYQTALAVGELADIQEFLDRMGIEALTEAVGPRRWAVVPKETENGRAETEKVARRLSTLAGGLAAAFQVHDSDALTAQLFRDGEQFHSYLSNRAVLMEWYDDDDNEILINLLGEPWTGDEPPPEEAIGGNADLFAPLGAGEIDLDALGRSLVDTKQFAERQHAAILRALNLRPDPLTEAYRHQASRIRN
jgi:hypothetical protein